MKYMAAMWCMVGFGQTDLSSTVIWPREAEPRLQGHRPCCGWLRDEFSPMIAPWAVCMEHIRRHCPIARCVAFDDDRQESRADCTVFAQVPIVGCSGPFLWGYLVGLSIVLVHLLSLSLSLSGNSWSDLHWLMVVRGFSQWQYGNWNR